MRRNNSLEATVGKLRKAADFVPDGPVETDDPALDELLASYPALASFEGYLEFLGRYGGAYVSCPAFSLGIYGFSGYNVPSFAEGRFLAENRYFNFADMQLSNASHAIEFFHFDLCLDADRVYRRVEGSDTFEPCRDSFIDFLVWVAALAAGSETLRR